MATSLMVAISVLVTLLVKVDQSHALIHTSQTNSTMEYLERALNGLELAMDFFKREHRHVNLDALIGTRMVQASFNVMLKRLDATGLIRHIPLNILESIKEIHHSASSISKDAMPYVIASDPDYYKNIGPILSASLFELDYKSRDIPDDVFKWPYSKKEVMKEEQSDNCLAEVFGTKSGVPCDISKACWKEMTNVGYSKYSLSHEIFYLEISEQYGCEAEMQWYLEKQDQGSVTKLQDMFCGNMFKESQLFADNNFPKSSQDLFMEQAAMCGLLGYRQFFTSEWLDKILSWQDPSDGCYRWDEWPLKKHIHKTLYHHITKREEKRVSRGCLCHRTAVAAAALSQYTRFVMEVWLQEHGLLKP